MSERRSLADDAIDALAAIRAMDTGMSSDAPERFHVWNIKRMAEKIVSDAMRQAVEISYMAKDIQSTVRAAEKGEAQ